MSCQSGPSPAQWEKAGAVAQRWEGEGLPLRHPHPDPLPHAGEGGGGSASVCCGNYDRGFNFSGS